MDKNSSSKADKTPQTSSEAPFTTFILLDKCGSRTIRICVTNVLSESGSG